MRQINERAMKEIAKDLGWSHTDNQPLNCAACVAGKAKQKSLKKVSVPDLEDEKDGYRACLNILMINKNKRYPITTNPYWRMIVVGTKLQLKFPHFYKSKDAMVEQHVNCCISGCRMGKRSTSYAWIMQVKIKIGIEVENCCMARDTPQQNSPVEIAFMPWQTRHISQCTM